MWDRIDGYRILGTSVRVQTQQADFGRQLGHLWKPFSNTSTAARSLDTFALTVGDGGRLILYHDCVRVAGPRDVLDAIRITSAELNRHVISRYRGLSFHAGVVASPSGVIAFPGESGVGKTTLVAAVASAGLRYVSDEALCVDSVTLRVIPYPRPLALGPWAMQHLGIGFDNRIEEIVEPNRFAPVAMDERLPISHVVSFRRRPGPSRLTPLPRSNTVTALLANSFNHYKDPPGTFDVVTQLARQSESWLLEYEDAFDAAGLLTDRLIG